MTETGESHVLEDGSNHMNSSHKPPVGYFSKIQFEFLKETSNI